MCQNRKTCLLLILIGLLSNTNVTCAERKKRSLYNFDQMIECVTDRHSGDFVGYGCYCGLGGTGTAVDAIDRCCELHDLCYRRIRLEMDCRTKTDNYSWWCWLDDVSDGDEIAVKPLINETVRCSDANHECENAICRCDMAVVKCFAHATYPDEKPKCPAETAVLSKLVNKAFNFWTAVKKFGR